MKNFTDSSVANGSWKEVGTNPDKWAYFIIFLISALVYFGVYALRVLPHPARPFSFDPYRFADACALLNGAVSMLLIAGRQAARKGRLDLHRGLMMSAFGLSCLFMASYFAQHYFVPETHFQGRALLRLIYFILLITHILLAAITLPMALLTGYFGMTQKRERHKKIVRYTFPCWLYVSVSGVLVYLLISPFYNRG